MDRKFFGILLQSGPAWKFDIDHFARTRKHKEIFGKLTDNLSQACFLNQCILIKYSIPGNSQKLHPKNPIVALIFFLLLLPGLNTQMPANITLQQHGTRTDSGFACRRLFRMCKRGLWASNIATGMTVDDCDRPNAASNALYQVQTPQAWFAERVSAEAGMGAA